jgi:hypothetical protein
MRDPAAALARSDRLLDPMLAGAVAFLVYGLHGFQGLLDQDLGTFLYGGQQFAHGVPPYRGIFNSVGPLGDALAGVAVWLGAVIGAGPVPSARGLYLLISVGCVALLSVLAREAFASRAAGLVAPAVFLTFKDFLDLATNGPREKTAMVLFLEAALILGLRRRWFGSGVLVAMATLTWQPVLAPAVAAVAVMVALGSAPRLRAAALFGIGGVLATSVAAAYFLAEHALRVAVWGFVLVNVGYTDQPSVWGDFATTWRFLVTGYGGSLAPVLVGIPLLVGLGFDTLRRVAHGDETALSRDHAVLAVAAGGLVATAWTSYAINGAPDLFVMLPFAALGVAGAVVAWTERLEATAARATVASLVAAAIVAAGVVSVATRDTRLQLERQDVAAVMAAAPPGATVLSVNAPEVLVILQRRAPEPWQLENSAMGPFLDDHLPGGLTAYAARIARRRPTLIAAGRTTSTVLDWLDPVLAADYRSVGNAGPWRWYASRSLGRRELRRLEMANSRARSG